MKGLVKICTNCEHNTEFGEISIEFERKGIRAAMSGIPAMVCPHCGQEYVPGEIASDVINTVSLTIDHTVDLFRRAEQHRKELLPNIPAAEHIRLALAV